MKPMIEELKIRGCDMEDTLARFLDNEEFYEECLVEMLNDEGFEKLGEAIQEHNLEDGFAVAHMLKGVIANMGVQPMLETISKIVEPFRTGKEDGVEEAYNVLLEQRAEFQKLAEENC